MSTISNGSPAGEADAQVLLYFLLLFLRVVFFLLLVLLFLLDVLFEGGGFQAFTLFVRLVEQDAAAVRTELYVLSEPDRIDELGRENHIAAGAHPLCKRDNPYSRLVLDDPLELEEDVLLQPRGYFLLFVLELLQLRVFLLDLYFYLGLLLLDVLLLLPDHQLLFFQGALELFHAGLLPLELLAEALLFFRGVL